MEKYERFKTKMGLDINKAFGDLSNQFGEIQVVINAQPTELVNKIHDWRHTLTEENIKNFRAHFKDIEKAIIFDWMFVQGLTYNEINAKYEIPKHRIASVMSSIYHDARTFKGMSLLFDLDPEKAVKPEIGLNMYTRGNL